MATKVKTAPVRLNETTLETNIVSEIAGLFRSPGGLNYPSRLRWFFDIPTVRSSIPGPRKVKIYRLTPPEEYHGGGWDSKVVIPVGAQGSRAVFIQFKSGRHSDGNQIPESLFNVNIKSPNKHAEFSFNDNSGNNQHKTLKNLHDELKRNGLPSKSVIYGFPRITDLETFDRLNEDLLLHTTFLSLSEMDAKATAKGADLNDNNVHHFRTCYFDESKREISSDPFDIGASEDPTGLLYEILLVRFAQWRNYVDKEIPVSVIDEEFYFELADFLRINPFELVDLRLSIPSFAFRSELRQFYKSLEDESIRTFQEIFGVRDQNAIDQNPIDWRKSLFKRAVNFVTERSKERILEDVPENYSFQLPSNFRSFKSEPGAAYNLLIL